MVASMINLCYIIGYPRYLCAFLYYISALISCRKQSGSVVSEQVALDRFQCMSPMMYEYSKLGLKLVSLEDNHSSTLKKPAMTKEKKKGREYDSINWLLKQALTR